MKLTDRKIVFLDSRNKTSGNYNNFNFNFNIADDWFSLKSHEKLFVYPLQFSILNDYYNITELNNKFLIGFGSAGVPTQAFQITVPVGYYNVYALGDLLQTEMTTQLNAYTQSVFGIDDIQVVVNYDAEQDAFSFAFTETTYAFFESYNIYFIFYDIFGFKNFDTLAPFIGFEKGQAYSGVETPTLNPTTSTITSVKLVNVDYQPIVYVYSNIVNKNLMSQNTQLAPTTLLFSVPVNVPKNSTIVFNDAFKNFLTETTTYNIQNISFSLETEDREPVYFQSDCQIALAFEKYEVGEHKMISLLEDISNYTQLNSIINQFSHIDKAISIDEIKNPTAPIVNNTINDEFREGVNENIEQTQD